MSNSDPNQQNLFSQPLRWLITGGTGFIGSALARKRLSVGDSVSILTRNPNAAERQFKDVKGDLAFIAGLNNVATADQFDIIVNLAGEPLFGGLWTEKRKKAFFSSRISTTNRLVELVSRLQVKPSCMISGSAIGFYGMHPEEAFNEECPPGTDDMARLCREWEEAAMPVATNGVRLVRVRIGLVLHESGGMLAPLSLSAKFSMAAKLGSGNQWMSWIALEDMVALIEFCATSKTVEGAINGTAPNPVKQAEFVDTLAAHYSRPRFIRIPAAPLKLLLGEMSDLLLEGQKVLPVAAEKAGFTFGYPHLSQALKQKAP